MKTIQFFHPEETFTYYIEKSFCKVVFSGQQHQLLIEIHSSDQLDHVEDDSLQNDFPQVILSVDDFPVNAQNVQELVEKTIEIPYSFVEIEDEEGDWEEIYYTTLNFSTEDLESDQNHLRFFKNEAGEICLEWKGEVQDFTGNSEEMIPFVLTCDFKTPAVRD